MFFIFLPFFALFVLDMLVRDENCVKWENDELERNEL